MIAVLATTLLLAAGTNALALRGNACDCSFHLSTSGDVSLSVSEDSEGEVLGGGGTASFCLNGDTIIDTQGRPCWFTPPTFVLQCDEGATPATGIAIGCDGVVSYNGQTTFYECHNGIGDEVNIYSKPDEGANCGSITLTADSCRAQCPTATCPAPVTVTATATVTEVTTVSSCPTSTACPLELGSDYQFPHLIIPIDSSSPNSAVGTSFFGQVSSTISTIFNFDIPASYAGKKCSLWFAFPSQSQLTTSSYTFSGSGNVDFKSLSSVATQGTTFANAPAASADLGGFTIGPGNAYKISTFSCPSGTAVSYEMSAGSDTALKYFQDFNPCPIGMYIVPSM